MTELVVIRVDSSLQIGTGHVMRCLTLADALRVNSAEIRFICRQFEGDLIEFIRSKDYHVYVLPPGNIQDADSTEAKTLSHAHWLGATQDDDIQACKPIVKKYCPDWLIVDHYALDYRWELELKDDCRKLMVIDDLADRKHSCDLLLDQTYGREKNDYEQLVPDTCRLLLGSQYALLRPEFAQWRDYSLKRRTEPQLKKLLISLGGADPENYTGMVLQALAECDLPEELKIIVVLGPSSPHLATVKQLSGTLPFKTEVVSNVSNMAELMTDADLAIGAAGATTWERCCLGLPSIMLVLADNQRFIADRISEHHVAIIVYSPLLKGFCGYMKSARKSMRQLSLRCCQLTEGTGVNLVIRYML
ncbi:UDP-2,4-diacetamido-2,4,6-trideoxy-beta-L-altropyranose hydrolase [Methylophaga nitratireducenticrescens]|uniref:UDP-2,4-diacetamido-2,4, 6-trideoxy-beta-L-altropyranose hydrolase n=1 Tax=Methylophaga nitratireducenticrescens TaxID=754476 RepID=UPI000CDBCDFA|nr:UDP-2,4-diacetamido-2,4,6-trideoxy-beta-L-altropyranose hydrolase [Methylophaga nitratireducenticrescens]AUZ84044.1 UDP-2,4-diacetamido-2,4,6-trideoxy-beta-L-altropyranose hydrolase [Methylophaga nitratireducenticrescens]